MSDISQLVKKITQARKIQKDRIEQAADVQTAEQESISKMTSPVVQEVAKQAAITQKAIETQHDTLKAIPHHLDNLQRMAHYKLEMDAASAPTPKRKPAKRQGFNNRMIQNLNTFHLLGRKSQCHMYKIIRGYFTCIKSTEIKSHQLQQKWKLI